MSAPSASTGSRTWTAPEGWTKSAVLATKSGESSRRSHAAPRVQRLDREDDPRGNAVMLGKAEA